MSYVPHTDADRRAMLDTIGTASVDDLFADLPAGALAPALDLPPALSEAELMEHLGALAGRNRTAETMPCFLGGGAYRHFVPSVVGHLAGRSEFYTAYTPYQPEVSQGTLQVTFEFQSMVCELTGMEVANAGLYDGASALAEAVLMACRLTGRRQSLLLSTVNPAYRAVVETYCQSQGIDIQVASPAEATPSMASACLVVQHPNYFGYLEDVEELGHRARAAGALHVVVADPISLGLLRPPGEYSADIVVGEAQPLGMPLSFGGPYLGFFACRTAHLRQMPGRIVGQARDAAGRVGYLLTLQTREQHIRRERATSNVCTAEALLATVGTAYLGAMGPAGLREVAEHCYHKAHYAADRIAALPGYRLPLSGHFFREFPVMGPRPPAEVRNRLLEAGILGGLEVVLPVAPTSTPPPTLGEGPGERALLFSFSELHSRATIDRLVEALGLIR
ncbi:MAG: aminomethyl-transferring glycine dehydrogenase subunit GcvPA [Chloroflexi bacterium]|nr:aminomethyl-transferring glycine dehydrogenase subunit GcvPA [Chloroflexota bacterium]